MQQSKIDIIVNEAPETDQQPSRLSKVFKALANRLPKSKPDSEPTINGSNYFTGELSSELKNRIGQMGMDAGREDWESLWRSVGAEPPGELPKGAHASLFVDGRHPDCHATTTVTSVTKTGGTLKSQWNVNYTPVAKGEERRVSYAVVILPKTKLPESFYSYNESAVPKQSPRTPKR